ncbi:MAG: hypothetical protein WDZ40_04420 [Candidatus Spechtbacterales bacterium]
MPQKTKIILFLLFVTTSLALVFWGAYKTRDIIDNEPASITNTTGSPIQIPGETVQKFNEKGNESQDAKILKQNLISPLQGNSGTIHQTTEYRIDYIPHPDTFMVEILAADFKNAQDSVFGWFLAQGFSRSDVCSMKILFYLSGAVKNYYQQNEQTIIFNPVFEHCDADF